MSPGRWIAAGVLIPLVWWFLQHRLVASSLAEDGGATIKSTHRFWSLAFLLVFAYSFTLFAWDLLLTLQVHVISAMWGIYQFVGALQAFDLRPGALNYGGVNDQGSRWSIRCRAMPASTSARPCWSNAGA